MILFKVSLIISLFLILTSSVLCAPEPKNKILPSLSKENLIKSINEFGLDIIKQNSNETENFVTSPIELQNLINVLSLSLDGIERKNLLNIIKYESSNFFYDITKDNKLLHETTRDIVKGIFSNSTELHHSNTIYHKNFGEYNYEHLDIINKYYDYDLVTKTLVEIFMEYTLSLFYDRMYHKRLNPVAIKNNTIGFLNQITFNGFFNYTHNSTTSNTFYNFGTNKTKLNDYFRSRLSDYDYVKLDNSVLLDSKGIKRKLNMQAILLPINTNDKFDILIMLPNSKNGINSLLNSLDSTILDFIYKSLKREKVLLETPEFSMASIFLFRENFSKKMATKTIFQNETFNKLFNKKVLIDNIINFSLFQFKAKQIEQTSKSSQKMLQQSTSSNKFIVDHPFMFVVRYRKTNVPIMMGRKNNI